MSAPPSYFAPYIGLLFKEKGRGPDGWDCWGLARKYLAERFGAKLPDYVDAYTSTRDKLSVAAAVRAGLDEGWERVTTPRDGTLAILKLAGRPWHCGVMGDGVWMLHTTEETNSCAERIDSLQWRGRIEGFYIQPTNVSLGVVGAQLRPTVQLQA